MKRLESVTLETSRHRPIAEMGSATYGLAVMSIAPSHHAAFAGVFMTPFGYSEGVNRDVRGSRP